MRRSRTLVWGTNAAGVIATALLLVKLTGCSGGDGGNGGVTNPPPPDPSQEAGVPTTGPLTIAPGPSRGSSIAISADDTIVVAVNRDVGSVTVFSTTFSDDGATSSLTKLTEVAVGGEPWQVAISPDSDSAYVVLRKDQKLVKIGSLKTAPAVVGSVSVGSEPTGVALTPGGTRAWVTNWVDGTLSGVDTASMTVVRTVDLNQALVDTKVLGDIAARPALAHPRSIAITNNKDGNESDESIYVTEYYAQRTTAEAADGSNADTAKSGYVYRIKVADYSVSTIQLGALPDIGFPDSNGGTAGCYPNQLQSITIQDKFAYISSICASPKGPVGAVTTTAPPNLANIKTTTHGVVSVVDLSTDTEVTDATATMHKKFDDLFVKNGVPNDGTRRYPAVPNDMGFVTGGGVGYVVSNASDALFRVRYDLTAASAITEVGATNKNFIDLNPTGAAPGTGGQNPTGIATANLETHKRFAFVADDITRNVSVVDFNTQATTGATQGSGMPEVGSAEDRVRKGKRFFSTATGRWSLLGQGWGACASCHVDGLTDNVTWYFARGPRQSTSLDGTFSKKDPHDQRMLNWSAINDEISDFEGNTRGISGGVGAIVSANSAPPVATDRIDNAGLGHAGLSGSSDLIADPANPLGIASPSLRDDWQTITEYVKTIRSPRRPASLDPVKVAAGAKLFAADGSCAGCHGGDKWTISSRFYTPDSSTNSALLSTAWTAPAGFPTSLLPATDQRFMRFQNGNAGAFDQMQCILRPVGTFGIADTLVGAMPELRQDMTTVGQGNEANGKGFNPPSLFGLQTGAPYLHGGGATTLEGLFSTTFQTHYGTLAPNFLSESDPAERAKRVDELVQFLLAIDADQTTVASPATAGAAGGSFCAAP